MPGITTAIEAAQELIEAEEQALSRIRRHSTPPKKHLTQSDSKHSPSNSKRKTNTKQSNFYDDNDENEEISPRKKHRNEHNTPSSRVFSPPSRMATRASPSPCRSSRHRSDNKHQRDVSPARGQSHLQSSQKKSHLLNSAATAAAEKEEGSRIIMTRSRASPSPVRRSPRNHLFSPSKSAALGTTISALSAGSQQLFQASNNGLFSQQQYSRKQDKISAKKDASTAQQLRQNESFMRRSSSPSKQSKHRSSSPKSQSPSKRNRSKNNANTIALSPTGTTNNNNNNNNQMNAYLESPEFGAQKSPPPHCCSSQERDRLFQLDPNNINSPNHHSHHNHHLNYLQHLHHSYPTHPLLHSNGSSSSQYPYMHHQHPTAFMGPYHHPATTATSKIAAGGNINGQQLYTTNPAELINNAMLLSSLLNQVKPAELALTSLLEHLLPQKANASNNQAGSNNNSAQKPSTESNNNTSTNAAEENGGISSKQLVFDEKHHALEKNTNNVSMNDSENISNTMNAAPARDVSLMSSPRKDSDSQSNEMIPSQVSQQPLTQQRHSVVIPSPKRIVPKNLSISSNSSFLRASSTAPPSTCPIHNTLKNKILPMLESKIRSNRLNPGNAAVAAFENDMWLCEIVDCVRHLKTLSIDVIYSGDYAMLLEQVYDALLTLAEQTDQNFNYVLSMLTRTMSELDRKIIKYLHDYSRVRGEKYSQTREVAQTRMYAMLNAIKIEDEPTIDVVTTSVNAVQAQSSKQNAPAAAPSPSQVRSAIVKVMYDSLLGREPIPTVQPSQEPVEEEDDDEEEEQEEQEEEEMEELREEIQEDQVNGEVNAQEEKLANEKNQVESQQITMQVFNDVSISPIINEIALELSQNS